MSKHLFIIAIPGTGVKKAGFSKGLQKELIKQLKYTKLKNNYSVIECRPFNETGIDQNQKELFERMNASNRLGGILSFRKTVLHVVGDAVLFERNPSKANSAYQTIHRCLRDRFEEVNQLMQKYQESILVIVAGSIGVHVLSCYIWDADHSLGIFSKTPSTDQNNLRNLAHLSTFGCNIPIYVSALKVYSIKAFDRRNANFSWDNYYDKDDVLGWPLQALSPIYNNLVRDHEINTGVYIGSHIRYWDDKGFVKQLAEKLAEMFNQ
ncbi:MAG: hypothetical protein ACERKD_17605 [Prolixibacteraceae bacterium]